MGVQDMLAKLKASKQEVIGGSTGGSQRQPPPIPHGTRPKPGRPAGRPFVVLRDGLLALDDGTPFRFASLNAPELLDGHPFEVEDTMRTLAGFGRRVTRTYTLKIKGTSPHFGDAGHINGWDHQKGDWIYDEGPFKKMDHVLAMAEKYDVRLIIPIIGQDFGSANDNWFGNWVDMIIYRKNLSSDYQAAKKNIDFFTDREMIESYKTLLNFLLNRVNTVNGKRYGDDPSILAWQTGNELQHNFRGKRPPPGEWTAEIARHIKSLAPHTLVMDGSFAKADRFEDCYGKEALKCKDVDILDYHYYGTGDATRVKKETSFARKYGKAFVVAEYGFFDSMNDYALFLSAAEQAGASGSLVWSLRPHSAKGGFKTHREDENNSAYHVPGWPNPVVSQSRSKPSNWDEKEYRIIEYIRHASYSINREQVPHQFPVPNAPHLWSNGNGSVSWQGAAWAISYEVWLAHASSPEQEPQWQNIGTGVTDAVEEGKLAFYLPPHSQGTVMIRGMAVDGAAGEWSNSVQV